MMLVLLALISVQSADELVGRLEAQAAKARGFVVRTTVKMDSISQDERYERGCGAARVEVSKAGTLWNESWSLWIGPERKSVTSTSFRSLTTPVEFVQLTRELSGFKTILEVLGLGVTPFRTRWKEHPEQDPWYSRGDSLVRDAVDPLLLYTLLPELLWTETSLALAKSDDRAWILETVRSTPSGRILKRFTIGKEALELRQAEFELQAEHWTSRLEAAATHHHTFRGLTLPSEGEARYVGFPTLFRWKSEVDTGAPEPPARSRDELPEKIFPTPGELDRQSIELERALHPENPQPLIDLVWGKFARGRWWSYSYFQGLEINRQTLKALRRLVPGSPAVREEWFRRSTKAQEADLEFMVSDPPGPLHCRTEALRSSGKLPEAEAVAREGLSAAGAPGERLNWSDLLAAVLIKEGKKAEATRVWLDAVRPLGHGDPAAQVLLAEAALGRGLASGFQLDTLAEEDSLAAALLVVLHGEGDLFRAAVRTAAKSTEGRPLMSEFLVARKIADLELSRELGSIEDVDTLLAAAALRTRAGEKADDLARSAVALWEKQAFCRLWTWDVWGRTTLRMLRELRALGLDPLALELASRFVEKCAEGKVPMWLGMYRWGDLVGDCLADLRKEGKEVRYVDLLALSPELASRISFHQRDGFVLPMKEILAHLARTRSREEATGWVRMACSRNAKPDEIRPLVVLAREIAPDDLEVQNAWLETAGGEVPLETKIQVLRRTIAATQSGSYRGRSAGIYGQTYEQLARAQIEGGKLEDAVVTVKEMFRDAPLLDAMTVINMGHAMGHAGRKDLERELYLIAAHHNAHLSVFSAKTAIENLERFGEYAEIYALSVRTLRTNKGGDRSDAFDRSELEAIRAARDRASQKVSWEQVFKPWLATPRAAPPRRWDEIASQAIADLGADEAERRDRAGRILVVLGEAAVGPLGKLALGGGPEEKGRAREILEQIYARTWK